MRGSWIGIGLGVTAMVVGPALAGESLREESEREFEARGLAGVRVENARGRVSLRRSSDQRIHLTAVKIVRARNRDQSERVARETQVSAATEGDWLVVHVRYPERERYRVSFWDLFSGFDWPRVEVRLGLEVPDRLEVGLHSTSGDLSSEGVSGPQWLETTSGDIRVRDARGAIEASSRSGNIHGADLGRTRARTASGELRLESIRGPLQAHATSGQVTIRDAKDSLAIVTTSGRIVVEGAPRGLVARTSSGGLIATSVAGEARLETSSGSIRVGLEKGLRGARISTTSGAIEVRLSDAVGCTLEMRTTSGSLDVSMPMGVKDVSRRTITGVIGTGGAPIQLTTTSGDIHVRRGGDR